MPPWPALRATNTFALSVLQAPRRVLPSGVAAALLTCEARRVQFFASCAKGTEGALRDELLELKFAGVRADRGGVHFSGERLDAFRACLWSRIAVRVLEPLGSFECSDEDELYAGVRALDFSEILSLRQTLSVSAVAHHSRLDHTQYIAQRTKDAIVDRQREREGARSNVDRRDADVQVFVHLARDRATVYLDLAGSPLHLRGYRKAHGEAPLKETLAAAVLRLSGFNREAPVLDPMCGSGTFLIEAALWALGRAPGIFRQRFGFERWHAHGERERLAMRELREAARGSEAPLPPYQGSDIDATVLAAARENAARAGVSIELSQRSFVDVRPTSKTGLLVSNPPYGERLASGNDLPRLLARLIDRFPDHAAGLLMAEEQQLGRTRRKPRFYSLFNGDIACNLRVYSPIDRSER
ncbi:MAG: THUMP domain-containing class I SAM-dependent RNA methyltransferase [Myxococcota bacterium]